MTTIGERFIEWIGGVSASRLDDEKSRSFEAGYASGFSDGEDEPISGTTKRYGYRKMSGGQRELEHSHEQMLQVAWSLWQGNPIAKRVLAIKRDYIVGGGLQISADNDDVMAVAEQFWKKNKLDMRANEFTHQLFLFGEQCFPAFVRASDGLTRLGYIDPEMIEKVVTHPENAMERWAVIVKSADSKRVYRIIREAEDVVNGDQVENVEHVGRLVTYDQATLEDWETNMLADAGANEYAGSCFYTAVNAVSNQARGVSDLVQNADWINQADETLFALAEREQMAGFFSFDVAVEGADKDKIKERSIELRKSPPKRGSVNVHNNKETWQLHAPDLKQSGSIEAFNALLTFVLGGAGFPRHWYGYGDETNRATAEAQNDPTWRSLEDDQGTVKTMFLEMIQFARDQAIIAGSLTVSEEDEEIDLIMPEMTMKDVSRLLAGLSQVATALMVAEGQGWIRQETAAKVFAKLVGELGIEVDAQEELDGAEDDLIADDEEDMAKRNGDLLKRLGDGNGPLSADQIQKILDEAKQTLEEEKRKAAWP